LKKYRFFFEKLAIFLSIDSFQKSTDSILKK